MRVGLVLSGGGARGYFHMGVAKALEEAELEPDIICGSSAGAIAGSLMAARISSEQVIQSFPRSPLYNIQNLTLGFKGLTALNTLKKYLQGTVPYRLLEEMPIPFYPVATNLRTGQADTSESGELLEWVMASCAIPVVVNPIKIGEEYYVDGGLSRNLPAELIGGKCDYLIGINLYPETIWDTSTLSNMKDVGMRAMEIHLMLNGKRELSHCDSVITTEELGRFRPHDYRHMEELVDLGYKTTTAILPSIHEGLRDRLA